MIKVVFVLIRRTQPAQSTSKAGIVSCGCHPQILHPWYCFDLVLGMQVTPTGMDDMVVDIGRPVAVRERPKKGMMSTFKAVFSKKHRNKGVPGVQPSAASDASMGWSDSVAPSAVRIAPPPAPSQVTHYPNPLLGSSSAEDQLLPDGSATGAGTIQSIVERVLSFLVVAEYKVEAWQSTTCPYLPLWT